MRTSNSRVILIAIYELLQGTGVHAKVKRRKNN